MASTLAPFDLDGIAETVTIVEAKVGKDAADHVTAGHGVDEFVPVETANSEDPDDGFWNERPVLTHIRDFARARRAGPWSTLGVVLARAIASNEPNVMLPPTVGGVVSMNFFLAAVGASGAGKGASDGAGFTAVEFTDFAGRKIEIDQPNIGSGEGLARAFRAPDSGDREICTRTRALIGVSEIDTLGALAGRKGATLMAELRKAYMGESIGFNNASKATTSAVGAHCYRLCLTVGVQPANAATLLDDAGGGTPQRFVWLPVIDPYAPDVRPSEPAPWVVKFPRWETTQQLVVIPDRARQEIDSYRLKVLRGNAENPLDGHAMLCRLKVAAALMILDGRSVMNDDDWRLAGQVMVVSSRTRVDIEDELTERNRQWRTAKAVARGEDEDTTAATRVDKRTERIAKSIARHLKKGEMTRGPLRKCLSSADRDYFESAVVCLVEGGIVAVQSDGDKELYSLC